MMPSSGAVIAISPLRPDRALRGSRPAARARRSARPRRPGAVPRASSTLRTLAAPSLSSCSSRCRRRRTTFARPARHRPRGALRCSDRGRTTPAAPASSGERRASTRVPGCVPDAAVTRPGNRRGDRDQPPLRHRHFAAKRARRRRRIGPDDRRSRCRGASPPPATASPSSAPLPGCGASTWAGRFGLRRRGASRRTAADRQQAQRKEPAKDSRIQLLIECSSICSSGRWRVRARSAPARDPLRRPAAASGHRPAAG